MAHDLYADDFYLWTQDQADALRARDAGRNRIDYDRLAEEIEDLGSSERNKCRSLILRIIQHLYKLETSRAIEPRGHWRSEIRTWRVDFGFVITRSLRQVIEQELEDLHAKAARLAQASLDEHERGLVVDAERRWSMAQLLGLADDPLEGDPQR